MAVDNCFHACAPWQSAHDSNHADTNSGLLSISSFNVISCSFTQAHSTYCTAWAAAADLIHYAIYVLYCQLHPVLNVFLFAITGTQHLLHMLERGGGELIRCRTAWHPTSQTIAASEALGTGGH